MQLSIKSKIIVGIFSGLLVFVLFVNGTLQGLLADISSRELNTSLKTSLVSYQRFEEQNARLLTYKAELIAQTPHLKATLSIPDVDHATLSYAMSDVQRDEDVSLLMILDTDGHLILDADHSIETLESLSNMPGVSEVLEGTPYFGYWHYTGDYYTIAMSPSIVGNQLLGVIIVGQKINDVPRLELIGETSGAKVLLHIGSTLFEAGSSGNFIDKRFADAVATRFGSKTHDENSTTELSVEKISIEGNDYFTSSVSFGNTSAYLTLYRVGGSLSESFKSVSLLILSGSGVALLLGLVFSLYISRKISQPVRALINAAKEFGQGHFDVRLKETAEDEIGVLIKAVNKMANDLYRSQQKLIDKDAAEKEMRRLAYIDPLTDLPNRRFFNEKLEEFLEQNKKNEGHLTTVFFIDVDNFKRINDSLGHDLGDELLTQFGNRLHDCIRNTDFVAKFADESNSHHISRLGGDEFTIILNHLYDKKMIVSVAERIISAYSKSFLLSDHEVVVTGSVGIATSDMDDVTCDKMVKCADLAMYEAKQAGKNNYKIYSFDAKDSSAEKLDLEIDMRRALDNNEFDVFFQPILNIQTNKIIGAEALARWDHPDTGMVPPDEFIPLAESVGLISSLGEKVLVKACQYFSDWQQSTNELEYFTVNFSTLQFSQSNLFHMVSETLESFDISPKCLVMEITESLSMISDDSIVEVFSQLKALGVQIAIDDFGTGYSSLAYISTLPLDILKIDRSFVSMVVEDQFNKAIISTILSLGDNLDLRVIAEGIETEEQLNLLMSLGLNFAQGYYLGRPLPAEEFKLLLSIGKIKRHSS